MQSRPVLLTVTVLGLVLAARLWAQPPSVQPPGKDRPPISGVLDGHRSAGRR